MQSFPIAIPLDAATPQIVRILPPPMQLCCFGCKPLYIV